MGRDRGAKRGGKNVSTDRRVVAAAGKMALKDPENKSGGLFGENKSSSEQIEEHGMEQANDGDLENEGVLPREFDAKWYLDDDASVGGRIKKNQEVLHTRTVVHKNKKLNLNCRVETIGRVIDQFCEKKMKWITEMGFASLIYLKDKGLPRHLCYWLATRVDVANRCIRAPDGNVFPLTKVQIHWVLGIPIGKKLVPRGIESKKIKTEVATIFDLYKTTSPCGTAGIKRSTIISLVEGPPDDEVAFKRAFLMMILGDFLCPTTCHRLSVSLLPAVTVAMDAVQYDWCSYVIDHLFGAIRNFALRFYNDGFVAGCGGCTYILAIVYLDRLRRPPVQWGAIPRVTVWSWKEVRRAEDEDRLECMDFGKLGCYDIAYGENHPLEGRDVLPAPLNTTDIVHQVISVIRSMDVEECNGVLLPYKQGRGRKRRGATTPFNPYDYTQRNRLSNDEGRNLIEGTDCNVGHESNEQPSNPPSVVDPPDDNTECVNQIQHQPASSMVDQVVNTEYENQGHEEGINACIDDQHSSKESPLDSCKTGDPPTIVECSNMVKDKTLCPMTTDAVCDQDGDKLPRTLDDVLLWADKLPEISADEQAKKRQSNFEEEPMDVSVSDFDLVENLLIQNLDSNVMVQNVDSNVMVQNVDLIVSNLSEYASIGMNSSGNTLSKYVVGVTKPVEIPKANSCVNVGIMGMSPARSYTSYDDNDGHNGNADVGRTSCETHNEDDDAVTSPVEGKKMLNRSRTPRKTKSCFKLSESYIQMWRPPDIRRFKKKLALFINIAGGELESNDTIMFECNGHRASIDTCLSVLSKNLTVNMQYVRVAVHLYKKVWDKKHTDRSQRFIIDPELSMELLNYKDGTGLAPEKVRTFTECCCVRDIGDINMIFVPVLQGNHWWCAAFSIISNEIAVIDPLERSNSADAHHLDILKLMHGMDDLLRSIDSSWPAGRCLCFRSYSVQLPAEGSVFDSGIVMLVAIKRRATRLGFNVYMESLDEETPWLLCEDLLNEFNEAKSSVKGLLLEHMK